MSFTDWPAHCLRVGYRQIQRAGERVSLQGGGSDFCLPRNGALPAKTGISPRAQLSKSQGWEVMKSENQSGQDELGY